MDEWWYDKQSEVNIINILRLRLPIPLLGAY